MEIQMHKFKLVLTAVMELKFSLPSPNKTINNVLCINVCIWYNVSQLHIMTDSIQI